MSNLSERIILLHTLKFIEQQVIRILVKSSTSKTFDAYRFENGPSLALTKCTFGNRK